MDTKVAGFEWDHGNREKNLIKHGVSCAEAEEVFFDSPMVIPDVEHTTAMEERFVALGETRGERLLMVVFTIRVDRIRVISARPMSREERSFYEAKKEESAD